MMKSMNNKLTIKACYLCYFMSGIVILSFGAILPELIRQKGLSYTLAGGLLTCMTIGNFLSTIVYPILCSKIKEKYVTCTLCTLYPICLFLFTISKSVVILYLLILLIGLNRGVITVTNNRTVNAVTNNSPKHLNILHMSYALGALLSPFAIALLTRAGIGWETLLRGISLITILIPLLYLMMDGRLLSGKIAVGGESTDENENRDLKPKDNDLRNVSRFLRIGAYWIALIMVFSYMGLENTVNGWFETYLQNVGIMSETLATVMVSVTWAMILVGRLIIASISDKFKTSHILCGITILQFIAVILLLNAHSAVMVVISLVLLGLGLAGIYPTLMALGGEIVNNSNAGMSLLTGVGAVGGIVLPQLIGIVADVQGFNTAILLMGINSVILLATGIIYRNYGGR